MTEQRYKAVLAVIANGRTVGEVASESGQSQELDFVSTTVRKRTFLPEIGSVRAYRG